MPITTSAKGALRRSIARRKINLARKETLARAIKQFKKTGKEGGILQQAIDKAAKHHLFHPRKAARLKARLLGKLYAEGK